MKAAVIYKKDELPVYSDQPDPRIKNEDEILIDVKAVAIKHFDKSRASGKHYSSGEHSGPGRIIGGDGVGLLSDGTRVYGMGVGGMLAEKAIIEKDRMVKLPSGIRDAVAAALPNAVIGSAMALRFKASLKKGEVVLINGATGFTGRMAVQIAKFYGAGKIIVTGRNNHSLQELIQMGADEIISLDLPDELLLAKLKEIHNSNPFDVIIDYLWGHSAEIILSSLKGEGSFTHRTRFVSVGSMTGDLIQLSAANLRSVDIQLSGSGLGSWSRDQVKAFFADILPDMFKRAADGLLLVEITEVKMKDIAELWEVEVSGGRRLVVNI